MVKNKFPKGWDEKKVQDVINYYENQTENEATLEAETALQEQKETTMVIPKALVPIVRQLIAQHQTPS